MVTDVPLLPSTKQEGSIFHHRQIRARITRRHRLDIKRQVSSRRSFVSRLLATPLVTSYSVAAQTAVPSKISRIETVYWKSRADAPFWPHWTWVRIDTDAGISGIGETYPRNPAEAAVLHSVAGSLIGHDPRDIERIWADFYRAFGFQVAGGAEIRALSAIDLALWDLLGKHLNAPVYRLIGGILYLADL